MSVLSFWWLQERLLLRSLCLRALLDPDLGPDQRRTAIQLWLTLVREVQIRFARFDALSPGAPFVEGSGLCNGRQDDGPCIGLHDACTSSFPVATAIAMKLNGSMSDVGGCSSLRRTMPTRSVASVASCPVPGWLSFGGLSLRCKRNLRLIAKKTSKAGKKLQEVWLKARLRG